MAEVILIKSVTTETSVYLLDEGRGTIRRLPGEAPLGDSEVWLALLRRDGEEVPLMRILQLEVGLPMQVIIDVRGDGILTHRETTLVRDIQDLNE